MNNDFIRPGRAPGSVANNNQFKATYVHERRLLEQFRTGVESHYHPALSLDGVSRLNTPEAPPVRNEWKLARQALLEKMPECTPEAYLRYLFKLLRRSDYAIPTVMQLSGAKYIELVRIFLKRRMLEIQTEFKAEVQRADTAITVNFRGSGFTFALSVYYAILDSSLELSPLFKYCLAVTTLRRLEQTQAQDPHRDKLKKLATQWEYLAALDYTICSHEYNEVWKSTIPEEFRTKAFNVLQNAIGRVLKG